MLIVFSALFLISIIIAILPRVLAILNKYYPESDHHWVVHTALEEESIVAAIAFSIHQDKNS